MVEKNITVTNSLGVHARPASMIVATAIKYKSSVQIIKDGIAADANSVLSVMMLAAAHGSELTIKAEGEDEQEVVDAIVALFNKKFNEGEL